MKRKTTQLFDLTFKYLIRALSPTAIVQFINGLFGTDYPTDSTVDYPSTESVSRKLRKLLSDTIIIINGIHVYHIEAQIGEDETIAVRVFEYGFMEGLRTKKIEEDVIVIKFPSARIIYWESTVKTPDIVTLRLEFPDGNSYDYNVKTLKYLDYSIEELENRKLAILLPFYVLKLRKEVVAASSKRRRELSESMERLLDELVEAVQRCARAGVMTDTDMLTVYDKINEMFKEVYEQYAEFKEANEMAQARFVNQWEVKLREAREQAAREEKERLVNQWEVKLREEKERFANQLKDKHRVEKEQAAREATMQEKKQTAREMLIDGQSVESIVKWVKIPPEVVEEIKANL